MSFDSESRQNALDLIARTRDLLPGPDRQRNLAELTRLLPESDIENLLDSDYPEEDILELCLRRTARVQPLDEAQLLSLVRRIMDAEVVSDAELNLLVEEFNRNCRHPAGSDLIFYPEVAFGPDVDPTPEEVVAKALQS